jgi:para-nitrobenzyl esterase
VQHHWALSLSAAYQRGEQFAAAAGCPVTATATTVVSCLTQSPPGTGGPAWTGNLVAAAQQIVINSPVSGAPVLPASPEQAILSGQFNKVPVIVGDVFDDNKLFDIPTFINMTPAQYVAAVDRQFGANASNVLALYPLSNYPSPFYAYAQLGSDSGFVCHSYYLASQLAQWVPTYDEEFNDPTSPTLFGFQPPGIDMSNAHSPELAYLWNFTLGYSPLTPTELALGDRMDRYWGAFARSGNPNTHNLVEWPLVTASQHWAIDFRPTGDTVSTTFVPTAHNCSFWASVEPMS